MKLKDIIRYKNIQVHKSTFEAFKNARAHFSKVLGRKVSHNETLTFLVMDFEAYLNAPRWLRRYIAEYYMQYWTRKEEEIGDPL